MNLVWQNLLDKFGKSYEKWSKQQCSEHIEDGIKNCTSKDRVCINRHEKIGDCYIAMEKNNTNTHGGNIKKNMRKCQLPLDSPSAK